MSNSDRGSRISFNEPLELEDLESAEDAEVFDRVTAIPSEVPLPSQATPPKEEDASSGLFERSPSTDPQPPPFLTPPTGTPQQGSRTEPPAFSPPVGARTEPPTRPGKLSLELADISSDRPPPKSLDALEIELPQQRPSEAPEQNLLNELRGRYATGDFSGALVIAEAILEASPEHEEARRCADRCNEVLAQMYLARLGSAQRVVRVAVPADQIRWLSLDHREGFLLSLAESSASVDELLDICGMPRLEALRILLSLLDQGVIALSD